MAERLRQAGLEDEVEVSSAGVHAVSGRPAAATGVELLRRRGVDLSSHRSRAVSVELVERSDLIVVMEEGQRQSLFHLAPEALARVFLLSELSGRHGDLEDPWGGSELDYERCIAEVERLLEAGWARLIATEAGPGRG
jgi:protein-tyrosine-phosphatase